MTLAVWPTFTRSMSDNATVVVTSNWFLPITVITEDDEPADTRSPAATSTAATTPVIGLVSTRWVCSCTATARLASASSIAAWSAAMSAAVGTVAEDSPSVELVPPVPPVPPLPPVPPVPPVPLVPLALPVLPDEPDEPDEPLPEEPNPP